MTVTCYAVPGERTSPRWCEAFALGCGGRVVTDARLRPGGVALFGSPKLHDCLRQAQAEARPLYYGDHAFFRRFQYYRIARDRVAHDGLPDGGPVDYDRLARLDIEIRPWRRGGAHILLCPPDRVYARREGFCAVAWERNITAELRRHTDRPIRVRYREGAERNPVALADDLSGAWALVTHQSNAAVEALVLGYPVFVTGLCAARAMAETDLARIESPRRPRDRERWAALLASRQWTFEEIAAGTAWRVLR